MQVSTVASESAFSAGGHVVDPYRSSLDPDMVQALVCTKDWITAAKRGKSVNYDLLLSINNVFMFFLFMLLPCNFQVLRIFLLCLVILRFLKPLRTVCLSRYNYIDMYGNSI